MMEALSADPFVGSDFTPEDFSAIAEILSEAGGVAIEHYNSACVKRRIAIRMRALEVTAAHRYVEMLRADAAEVQRLAALISLHVSTFYRDPTTFAALRQRLQEKIRTTTLPSLRCWSAGCAGGEEAYSLALMAEQIMALPGRIDILASDISQEILEKARGGVFAPAHLCNVSDAELSSSFSPEEGGYRIAEKLRTKVRFLHHDLLAESPYPQVDLILCRYVLIYLNAADQEQIIRRFAAALSPGGILVLGRTENLRDPAGCFLPLDASERIYHRV